MIRSGDREIGTMGRQQPEILQIAIQRQQNECYCRTVKKEKRSSKRNYSSRPVGCSGFVADRSTCCLGGFGRFGGIYFLLCVSAYVRVFFPEIPPGNSMCRTCDIVVGRTCLLPAQAPFCRWQASYLESKPSHDKGKAIDRIWNQWFSYQLYILSGTLSGYGRYGI